MTGKSTGDIDDIFASSKRKATPSSLPSQPPAVKKNVAAPAAAKSRPSKVAKASTKEVNDVQVLDYSKKTSHENPATITTEDDLFTDLKGLKKRNSNGLNSILSKYTKMSV